MVRNMTETFRFIFESPISWDAAQHDEHNKPKTIYISGTLIKSGISRNGNQYDIEVLGQIAQSAVHAPIYFGVTCGMVPNTGGLVACNVHDKSRQVGYVTETWVEDDKVKFKAMLMDPEINKVVKQGWGISIGGIANKFKEVISAAGKKILKILKMTVNHVQLLSPKTKRGVHAAVVGKVTEESMIFVGEQGQSLSKRELTAIITALYKAGELD